MGTVSKGIVIVLAVGLLALIVMDTRICLEADTVGGDIGSSAGRLSSCVVTHLDQQQQQVRQQLAERFGPTPAPAAE
jgi:hypothetical protein